VDPAGVTITVAVATSQWWLILMDTTTISGGPLRLFEGGAGVPPSLSPL
jgi:hypothetical protein